MSAPRYRAKVRMYRHGLGDCFLVTLPRATADPPYYVMIDCGVMPATENPAEKMHRVVEDVHATTGGRVDLLIATHHHWDHLSGFVQARDAIERITFGEVWLAWTENDADAQARDLTADRNLGVRALHLAAARLQLFGARSASTVQDFAAGFGVGGATTADAMNVVKGRSQNVRYCEPADDPVVPDGTTARLYVLGPPREERFLRKSRPSARGPETYELGLGPGPALGSPDGGAAPATFADQAAIPIDVARTLPFFVQHYYGSPQTPAAAAPAWRLIDTTWLNALSSELALTLDSNANNASLVLAIELDDGDVLLFPGDAQVGSWLSWQGLSWTVDGKQVTGPDLLRRCILYKVGHHGSHNATLREHGLETMDRLQTALIPVDRATALKKKWTLMPRPSLVKRLGEKAERVIHADVDFPAAQNVTATDDYYEVTL
jgi:Metallo-beta-lactamase superfamily